MLSVNSDSAYDVNFKDRMNLELDVRRVVEFVFSTLKEHVKVLLTYSFKTGIMYVSTPLLDCILKLPRNTQTTQAVPVRESVLDLSSGKVITSPV